MTEEKNRRVAIKEVVLENFMSYEYARIPLKPGLNIISGPNGSGKSSIVLAISVALGQAYTERSRRLSDLIRRGKETARVSLLLDNRSINGKRPIEISDSDTFLLSRYLKRDGSYWYEADYREVSKYQVERIFRDMGLNPGNMLIIMHQNMPDEFAVVSPQEKLRLLEEAMGFQEYRERIREAEGKLSALISEETSVAQLLGSAEQTLSHWKEVYQKYLRKRELEERLDYLQRELVWAQVARQEKTLQSLREKLKDRKTELKRIESRMEDTKKSIKQVEATLKDMKMEHRKAFYSLLQLEKEKTGIEAEERLFNRVKHLGGDLKEIREEIEEALKRLPRIGERISETQTRLGELEEGLEERREGYVNHRISEAILGYRRRGLRGEIKNLEDWVREAEGRLASLEPAMQRAGKRITTERTMKEIQEEIGVVTGRIEALGDIPEEAERMYGDYSNLYQQLKERMEEVERNREQAMQAVETRKRIWRRELRRKVKELAPLYSDILSQIDARGEIRLVNLEDIEDAGLELLVGFRGAEPAVLDARTQSGGERSTSVIAFLMALQRHVISPFRAVDEFDIHMDSKNREVVYQMIVSAVKESGVQYIVITPRQLAISEKDVNLIVVQNVYGKSEVKKVA
jgi:chromosome segregation protein